ncbi:hypothetical protein KI387_022669 [Taxus chinensis]|uniref:F-box domain-containing protein n=1 Tax=Taxus chinensis TaxID=29808 RepID=A0AA38G092_TAXCH|nr:hypothetical protein KI387_022669 [Taxus chinensis]
MGSLFPKLPDEIGWEILLRVEFNSHNNLRSVCKSWKAVLKCSHFYQDRKRLKLSEQRICMIQDTGPRNGCPYDYRVRVFDPIQNIWKTLSPVPKSIGNGKGIRVNAHFYSVKQKLVFVGGWDPYTLAATKMVCLYDFSSCKWRQGTDMPRWRDQFASAADAEGRVIYVAGGCNKFRAPLRSAAVYKVDEDKWDFLPDMPTAMDGCQGAFVKGKFFVRDMYGARIQCFHPHTETWKTMADRRNTGRIVSAFGNMYCFSSLGLIEYNCSESKWNIVGSYPTDRGRFLVNWATVFGHNIILSTRKDYSSSFVHMLVSPSRTQGAMKLIEIEIPSGFQGFLSTAATLDV